MTQNQLRSQLRAAILANLRTDGPLDVDRYPIRAAVLAQLTRKPKHITELCGFYSTVSANLSLLVRDGHAVRTGPGMYALPPKGKR